MNNEWLEELAGMLVQVKDDVVEMAGSGQYPVVVLVRGYDLLECLADVVCDPMDRSPSSSSVHGILQARILEWIAISSSRGSSQPRD